VAAAQGPDGDGTTATEHFDVFYQPVGIIGQFTSTTTTFDAPPSGGSAAVVLNEEGELKRRKAKYLEATFSEQQKQMM
jgi:hypothetical protein